MKLSNLVPEMEKRFARITNLREYAAALKSGGEYNDYNKRLAWDCLYTVYTSAEMCEWYAEYGSNDTHITTAAKAALRNMGIL